MDNRMKGMIEFVKQWRKIPVWARVLLVVELAVLLLLGWGVVLVF